MFQATDHLKKMLHCLIVWAIGICVSLVVLNTLVPYDVSTFSFVHKHFPKDLLPFMSRSCFEGKSFGASDIPTFLGLLILAALLLKPRFVNEKMRRKLGFILTASLMVGAGTVHPVKRMMDRTRPYVHETLVEPIHSGADGNLTRPAKQQSFPSGHTASMVSLGAIVLAFAERRKTRWFGFAVVTSSAMLMAAARIASHDHWPTDTLGAILLGWFTLGLWYKMVRSDSRGLPQVGQQVLMCLGCIASIWALLLISQLCHMPLLPLLFFALLGVLTAKVTLVALKYWMPTLGATEIRSLKRVALLTGFMTFIRYVLANSFPMTNDESYYWDWARSLQWSYLDHPAGVAWASWAAQKIFGTVLNGFGLNPTMSTRLFPPLLHAGTQLGLIAACSALITLLQKNQSQPLDQSHPLKIKTLWLVSLLWQLTPLFSMIGVFTLPDTGLYLLLSWALYLFVQLLDQEAKLSPMKAYALAALLGLAFCFKYHAGVLGLSMLLVW